VFATNLWHQEITVFTRLFSLILIIVATAGCHQQNHTYEYVRPSSLENQNQYVFQEKVISSDGYANISAQMSDNPSQRRLMAIRASKIDAYRNLTEKVFGQNVNSTTTVEDMVTTSDTIRAHVEGLIYGAKLISITPIGDDAYMTRLELDEKTVNEIRHIFIK
jgi:hypothetical protein